MNSGFHSPNSTTNIAKLVQYHCRILTGSDLGALHWSDRATRTLETHRADFECLDPETATLLKLSNQTELWTSACGQANQFLSQCLAQQDIKVTSTNGLRLVTKPARSSSDLLDAITTVTKGEVHPAIDTDHPMLRGLKFSELLPPSS